MDLIKLLQNLKEIEPDQEYAKRSKRLILSTALKPEVKWSIRQLFFETIQSGSAIALSGLLILLLIGGFTVGKILFPSSSYILDYGSLRAEAEAIDIQIQLTNLTYEEPLSDYSIKEKGEERATTIPLAPAPKKEAVVPEKTLKPAATSSMSVDSALEILSR